MENQANQKKLSSPTMGLVIALPIIVVLIIFFIILPASRDCADLNEKECKKDKNCLSVEIPCTADDCPSATIFKECKDK